MSEPFLFVAASAKLFSHVFVSKYFFNDTVTTSWTYNPKQWLFTVGTCRADSHSLLIIDMPVPTKGQIESYLATTHSQMSGSAIGSSRIKKGDFVEMVWAMSPHWSVTL